MSKLSSLWVSITGVFVFTFSVNVYAKDAINLACFGGVIDAKAGNALIRLSEKIKEQKIKLTLPANCIKTIKVEGHQPLPNPYVASLEAAAGTKTNKQFAQDLGVIVQNTVANDVLSRAITDSTLATYMRMACGKDRGCVEELVQQIPSFHPEKSPVFCDFAIRPDASVVDFFESTSFSPMTIACLRHSAGNTDDSISPLDNWFNAFLNLGENHGR